MGIAILHWDMTDLVLFRIFSIVRLHNGTITEFNIDGYPSNEDPKTNQFAP